MIYVETLLYLLALAALLPVLLLSVQVLMALPAHRLHGMPAGRRPALAVVIPAHDEAKEIRSTLSSIIAQLACGDRLIVVADNCSDDTAGIASLPGVEVIERKDEKHRGKGYALDFGVRHLESKPPEVVVFMDADCKVAAGAIDRLARTCLVTARPVQAAYLMRSPDAAGAKTRIAEFAWAVKNYARPLGYHRLGLPCHLMGSGMAIPWSRVSTAALASPHIAEDLVLGIDLARSGAPPLFCPDAMVTSLFAASAEGMHAQRMRWEHGHLSVILGHAPRLVRDAIAHGDAKLMALVLDLCVPPLALLTTLLLAVFAACAVFLMATEVAAPLWLATTALAMLGLSLLSCWWRYGRQVVSLNGLACSPVYLLGKMPLYLRFLWQRQAEWVRTRRDGD